MVSQILLAKMCLSVSVSVCVRACVSVCLLLCALIKCLVCFKEATPDGQGRRVSIAWSECHLHKRKSNLLYIKTLIHICFVLIMV